MRPIRSLALALTLALVSITLASCSLGKEAQARMAILQFVKTCKGQVAAEYNKEPATVALGDAVIDNLSTDTCTCITAKLRAMPAEKVIALNGPNATDRDMDMLDGTCTIHAMRPHIGELCMAGAKQGGRDLAAASQQCACAQRKVAAMDEATLEKTFDNIEAGFDEVDRTCATGK